MEQRLEQIESTLRIKAKKFDAEKERAARLVRSSIKSLRDLITHVENNLLDKVERTFENNFFISSLSEIENEESLQPNYAMLEEASMMSVPSFMGPSEADFLEVKKAILCLESSSKTKEMTPKNVKGKLTDANAIDVSWDNSIGATGYLVEMRKTSDGTFHKVYEGRDPKFTIEDLCAKTKYLFRVRSTWGNGSVSEWCETVKVKTEEHIPVPRDIRTEFILHDTIKITWDLVPGDFSYNVSLRMSTDTKPRIINCGKEQTITVNNLTPDTKYFFCVQAGNGDKWGKWSNEVPVETMGNFLCWREMKDYTLNETKTKVSFLGNNNVAAIGMYPLPTKRISKWKFKVGRSIESGGGELCLGLTRADFVTDKLTGDPYDIPGWILGCYFCCRRGKYATEPREYGPRKSNGSYVGSNECVGAIFDPSKGELSFEIKGRNLGVAFNKIPLDVPLYIFSLSCSNKNTVELLPY